MHLDITFKSEDRTDTFKSLRDYSVLVLGRIDPEAERQGLGLLINMLSAETVETRQTALRSRANLGPKAGRRCRP